MDQKWFFEELSELLSNAYNSLTSNLLCLIVGLKPTIFIGRSKTSGMKLTLTQILLIALSILSLLLFLRLWLGTGSYPEIWDLQGQIAEQKRLNEEQTKRNEGLQSEVLDISRDDAAIEDRARSELGMIKQGETFYQVILNSDPTQVSQAPIATNPPQQPSTQPHVE